MKKKKKAAKKAKAKSAKKKTAQRKPVRKAARRPAKRRVAKKRSARASTPKPIGTVVHFYTHIKVAIVKFSKPARVGDRIRMKGATTDFVQTIESLQFDHKPIARAQKGKQTGMKVAKRVREGDKVFVER